MVTRCIKSRSRGRRLPAADRLRARRRADAPGGARVRDARPGAGQDAAAAAARGARGRAAHVRGAARARQGARARLRERRRALQLEVRLGDGALVVALDAVGVHPVQAVHPLRRRVERLVDERRMAVLSHLLQLQERSGQVVHVMDQRRFHVGSAVRLPQTDHFLGLGLNGLCKERN